MRFWRLPVQITQMCGSAHAVDVSHWRLCLLTSPRVVFVVWRWQIEISLFKTFVFIVSKSNLLRHVFQPAVWGLVCDIIFNYDNCGEESRTLWTQKLPPASLVCHDNGTCDEHAVVHVHPLHLFYGCSIVPAASRLGPPPPPPSQPTDGFLTVRSECTYLT